MKRRTDACEAKRQFSSRKFLKLGDLDARLGLTSYVSQNDIKKAYYKLSLEFHPDKNQGCKESSEKFRSISEAYEILGNVDSRAQYDRGNSCLTNICIKIICIQDTDINFNVILIHFS